ncbi:EF-hand domain-containing protein [Sphingomonas sp.]|uniref:EF-hand domain-containing protein n=1 Tax=Sphingomonas sp. TaxID=28214 RepID=UPI0031D37473
MWRYFVGGIAALLMAGAGIFLFRGSAAPEPVPPAPRAMQTGAAETEPQTVAEVPRADRSREEKRFDRSDKDRNGMVTLAEMQQPRRKAFAKLDKNGDGTLSFEEWTVRTSTKFADADKDKSGGLTRAEFAATAPKRRAGAGPRCNCRAEVARALAEAADE